MKTKAPSPTKRFAVAKPIPVVPPVTKATFPCNLPIYRRSILPLKAHHRSGCGPGWPATFRGFRNVGSCAVPRAIIRDGLAIMPRSSSSRAWSLALDPCRDRSRRIGVESPVEVFCNESDMRRRQEVLEGTEWMCRWQGLGIENVHGRSCDSLRAQGLDERLLIDDRTARCVDQSRRRFHECQFGGADETAGALAQDEVDGHDIRPPKKFVLRREFGARGRRLLRGQ